MKMSKDVAEVLQIIHTSLMGVETSGNGCKLMGNSLAMLEQLCCRSEIIADEDTEQEELAADEVFCPNKHFGGEA